jgi:hypothetical protein
MSEEIDGDESADKTKSAEQLEQVTKRIENLASGVGEPQVRIRNQTVRRIVLRIKLPDSPSAVGAEPAVDYQPLVMPAFGTKLVPKSLIDEKELAPWLSWGLIEYEEVKKVSADFNNWGCLGTFLAIVASIVVLLVPDLRSSPYLLPGAGLAVLGFAIYSIVPFLGSPFGSGKEKDSQAKRGSTGIVQRTVEILNVVIVLAISFGLPAVTVYFFSNAQDLLSASEPILELSLLGRIMQLLLIGIASALPALLYMLFPRRRMDKVRQDLLQEIMQLDGDIINLDEAELKYGTLVDDTYGSSRKFGLLFATGSPILISNLLITIGWTLVLLPVGVSNVAGEAELASLLIPRQTAFNFGFLGAYFFLLNLVFRRYVRNDLTPKAFTHITVRILTAFIVVAVISLWPTVSGTEGIGWVGLWLAFFVGIFPETGLTFIQDILQKALRRTTKFPSLQEKDSLELLEGINIYDRTRLREEGVENIENLAHFNPIELVLGTRIPTARLVDLFDQAILYLHTKQDEKRNALRALGIRTATDLEVVYYTHHQPDNGGTGTNLESDGDDGGDARSLAILKTLNAALDDQDADQPDASGAHLRILMAAMQDDDWMPYLRRWRRFSQARVKAYTFKELEEELRAPLGQVPIEAQLGLEQG